MKEPTEEKNDTEVVDAASRKHREGGFWSRLLGSGQTASIEALTAELGSMENKLISQEQELATSKLVTQELESKVESRTREQKILKSALESERVKLERVAKQLIGVKETAKVGADERVRQLKEAKAETNNALRERNQAHLKLQQAAKTEASLRTTEHELKTVQREFKTMERELVKTYQKETLASEALKARKSEAQFLKKSLITENKKVIEAQERIKSLQAEYRKLAVVAKHVKEVEATLSEFKAAQQLSMQQLAKVQTAKDDTETRLREVSKVLDAQNTLKEELKMSRALVCKSSQLAAQVLHRVFGVGIEPALAGVWRHKKSTKTVTSSMGSASAKLQEKLLAAGVCQRCKIDETKAGLRVTLSLTESLRNTPGYPAWISAVSTELLREACGRDLTRRVASLEKGILVFDVYER